MRLRDGRKILRQMIARKQLDLLSVLVSQQADAVELSFKAPFRSIEALLCERRGHGFDPVGESFRHATIIQGAVGSE